MRSIVDVRNLRAERRCRYRPVIDWPQLFQRVSRSKALATRHLQTVNCEKSAQQGFF